MPGCANCSVSPGHKHVGVAFGFQATGPFVDLTPDKPVFPFASEDPCIFLDTRCASVLQKPLLPTTLLHSVLCGPPSSLIDTGAVAPCSNTNKGDVPKWHLLAHTDFSGVAENGTWAHVSAHAVARSPWQPAGWKVLDAPPYTRNIEWAGGRTTTVRTRERPQLIFDGGQPVALSNGVQPGDYSSPWTPEGWTGDWSYTHVQMIAIKGGTGPVEGSEGRAL